MEEYKISTNTIEALRSNTIRISATVAEEVVCMKSRHHRRATQHGIRLQVKWQKHGELRSRLAQNTFVASRIELRSGAVGAQASRRMRPENLSV